MAVCPEYQRLADALRAALERVYPLQKQHEEAVASKDTSKRQAAAVLLNDARREAREAEKALDRHSKHHGCGPPRESP